MNEYQEKMIKLVKAAGYELVDRAADLVGSGDHMTDLNIWLRFPPEGPPNIEVSREHISKRCLEVLINEGE